MRLTEKQRAWIDFYKQGHTATEAARLAGYRGKNLNRIGHENLTKLDKHIADRDIVLESSRIADMQEINAFWTSVIRDKDAEMKDRLKAAELRARSAGGFIYRQEIQVVESTWFKDG